MHTNQITYCPNCRRAINMLRGICPHCHKAFTHLSFSLDQLYWLESLIPHTDTAHDQIMNEIERLADMQVLHDEEHQTMPGLSIVVTTKPCMKVVKHAERSDA